MSEALALVRRTFGTDAMIIYTKTLRAPGLRGFFGKEIVEIAAASDVPRRETTHETTVDAPARVTEPYRREAPAKEPEDQLKRLRDEILGIRSTLDELVRSNCPPGIAGLSAPLSEAYMTLVRHGVTEQLASEVVECVSRSFAPGEPPAAEGLRERITASLAEHVKTSGPLDIPAGTRRVVAMVGPTGVGKTTTIAKLAANFKVRARRDVALVTIDTYRIAAVQQLQTIADIIKVPLRTVLTVGDLKQTMDDLRNYELVLIDTAGRSQRDELKMNDLEAFLRTAAPDEIHLVVSAAGSMGNMLEVVERFRSAGPNRLLMTKVDEAEALGRLVSLSSRTNIPVSYFTTGQDIPDDIEVASATRLAAMAWER
jgi:flagellar biosynthesis protein FlhF